MLPIFCQHEAINSPRSCVLLTVIIMRRASIIPSVMYKLLVSPPAHRGPRMVARPPTERLTPWLNPFGDTSQRIKGYSFAILSVALRRMLKQPANLVFFLQWLWRRETPGTRPRRAAPATGETLRWRRPKAPIHNHLAGMERSSEWD